MRAAVPWALLGLTGCSLLLELDAPADARVVGVDFDASVAEPQPDFETRPEVDVPDAASDISPVDAAPPPRCDVPNGTICRNPLGETRCVDGVCVPRCDEGASDADGDPANGCETFTLSGAFCGPPVELPNSVTLVVEDLEVCPFDVADETTGALRLRAGVIRVAGTVDLNGKGYGGGGGGGGGAGDCTGEAVASGGGGGLPGPGAGRGSPGGDSDARCCGQCAGGGAGGVGGGPAGGAGGRGAPVNRECNTDGAAGDSGDPGTPGGYVSAGVNGDRSTDLSVRRGSGGGGGGGGAGSRALSGPGCECPGTAGRGGAGGGGGGAGSPGGGVVQLVAAVALYIDGELRADGASSAGGDGESGDRGAEGECIGAGGGRGGRGGGGADEGSGRGGEGREVGEGCGVVRSTRAGEGGEGGPGAGGGILLRAPELVIEGRVSSLGGGGQAANGGTVKVFHCGDELPRDRLAAGRVYEAPPTSCP